MSQAAPAVHKIELDLSDVKHRVGQEVGGGEPIEPCSASDIRRWVMAMDYFNPIHWDDQFARDSKFRGIVAPQSFAVGIDYGHGVQPACVGCIPGSHLIFGGEEWWHYGPRIRPGDRLIHQRRFYDYRVTETKFAGPTATKVTAPAASPLSYAKYGVLGLGALRTLSRTPTALGNAAQTLLPISLYPQISRGPRNRKLLTQFKERFFFSARSYHELHALLL